jgi:hypothetical protein
MSDQLNTHKPLTDQDRAQIASILELRANEVASYEDELRRQYGSSFRACPDSVQMALAREAARLRGLTDRLIKADIN